MTKVIKNLLPNRGVGYRVVVKPFVRQQTWSAMIGYFTKDQYKSHYQVHPAFDSFSLPPPHSLLQFPCQLLYPRTLAPSPHYPLAFPQVETHNIDAQELAAGQQSRLLLSTSYHEADKITLNFKNIFNEVTECAYPSHSHLNQVYFLISHFNPGLSMVHAIFASGQSLCCPSRHVYGSNQGLYNWS